MAFELIPAGQIFFEVLLKNLQGRALFSPQRVRNIVKGSAPRQTWLCSLNFSGCRWADSIKNVSVGIFPDSVKHAAYLGWENSPRRISVSATRRASILIRKCLVLSLTAATLITKWLVFFSSLRAIGDHYIFFVTGFCPLLTISLARDSPRVRLRHPRMDCKYCLLCTLVP